MDPMTGQNRGYAFLSFLSNDSAKKCVQMYDRYEIRNKAGLTYELLSLSKSFETPRSKNWAGLVKIEPLQKRELHVTISQPNNRLFVGSIPKTKTKEEIFDEFHKHTSGLTEVILYYQVDEKSKVQNGATPVSGQKNRGFCFLEYDTHQAASQARRRLLSGNRTFQDFRKFQNWLLTPTSNQISGRVKAWNNLIVTVDWADPINSPASEIMDKVKVLYVKNLASTVTEESLITTFSVYGEVEKAKKLKGLYFFFKVVFLTLLVRLRLRSFCQEGRCS